MDGNRIAEVDVAKAPKPRRTREHVIASQSFNYLEKFIIDQGHTAERQSHDYGYDLIINTYDAEGSPENGEIRVQLKASDRLQEMKHGDIISLRLDIKHYELWINEYEPVFLVLYDGQARRAYWLHVQAYFAANPSRRPKRGARTLTVHIPLANEFTEHTVEYMRARKAAFWAQWRKVDDHG
ncbi:MAG TPA: DUF4365 domain-containing protein [Isosphaeraceae bacterium]|nr:DUF4365 domain-containing protein [Isosphaeraceae bacterium]